VGETIAGYRLRDSFADLNRLRQRDERPLGAIGVFVTEAAGITLKDKYMAMLHRAQRDYEGKVFWHLSPVQSTAEEVVPLLDAHSDIKLYSTYRNAGLYSSYEVIGRWMQALQGHETRILVHCEDDLTVQEYSAKHPFRHPHDHCLRRPELAEVRAVERVLDLAITHQHPVHIVHVSSPQSALLIKAAKQHFAGITCETAPHYLLFNEDKLKEPQAHRYICTPPFRSEKSRGILVELLQDGVFDILASDHCAFTEADKDRYRDEPEQVPCGIAGVETLYSSVYSALVETGKLSEAELDRLCRIKPAELMNMDELQD
jgi:dihydropyrimidinase